MIDITNLTSLITAFRNETEQGSISPETLDALLQAIAEEIQNAASDQDQTKLSARYALPMCQGLSRLKLLLNLHLLL